MRPPRIAILVLFSAASLFLVCRSIASARRTGPGTASLSQKSSFRALFSFSSPFSLFPPSAAISLTDDNSTFFPARPAAFGPPLPAKGLSGQLWIGSGFSDETLQEGEGEGELGCSDIPGWEDGRLKSAIKAAAQGSASSNANPLVEAAKTPGMSDPGNNMLVGWDAVSRKRPRAQPKPPDDGTDDYLHQALQQARSPYSNEPTGSGMDHADIQSLQESAEITGKIALLSRGGCGFLEKVKWAQRRGAIALIVGDNQKGGPLIQMFARGNVDNVTIPSVFTSWTTAHLLSSLMQPGSAIEDVLGGKGNAQLKVRHSSSGGTSNNARMPPSSPGDTTTPGSLQRSERSTVARRGWISRLFRLGDTQHVSTDTSRPPTSGRLDWVPVDALDDENNKLFKPSLDKATKDSTKGPRESSEDGFEIGVQDWREADYARTAAQNDDVLRRAGEAENTPLADINRPKGGSITPSSGEYVSESVGKSISSGPRKSKSSSSSRGGLLSRIFGSDDEANENTDHAADKTGGSSATTPAPAPTAPAGDDAHEGLWVTITPTGSASPFFDTLLVLVISPLITLTVVYALLILRVKIRMRRWRAPKSVVDRLPVRTYHTIAPSPAPSPGSPSSKTPSPRSSSPTTPLLQSSSESQPQSHAVTGTSDSGEPVSAHSSSQANRAPSRGKNSRGISSEWKKYMGRQVECVVCLEEYIDGVSRVMSLPCGHEFHAECITPWLTTRRRTCPICKNDVVRSLARGTSSGPQYEPFREDDYESSSGESSDTYQERVPSPNGLEDLERGPSWNQSPRQDWHANRNDVWFSALASRFGGSSSFSTRRDGSGADRGR
ncbi:uncharacterized protein P884DRAFT_216256 [Thermothelomyces heterothallicus CBS 202.75]|uniref:uncharacterized protein n=1 Tax=Thermothelomyces heterothallicus CBS 202.75 TaxID=1149848 RepID=UPI0037430CC5